MCIWKTLACLAAILAGLTCQLAAETPSAATAPATNATTKAAAWNQLECGAKKATFEFWQNDKQSLPDSKGVIHLAAKPFAIHIVGDVSDVFVLTSTKPEWAAVIKAVRQPLVVMEATGCAYGEGDLIVQESAGLAEWDEAKRWMFANDEAQLRTTEKNLKAELGELPLVFATGVQYVATFAPDDARDHKFIVRSVYVCEGKLFDKDDAEPVKIGPEKLQHLTMAVCVTAPMKTKFFSRTSFRIVTLEFDGK